MSAKIRAAKGYLIAVSQTLRARDGFARAKRDPNSVPILKIVHRPRRAIITVVSAAECARMR